MWSLTYRFAAGRRQCKTLGAVLLLLLGSQLAAAQPSPTTAPPPSRHWRVCLGPSPVPPLISLDEQRPGLAERLMLDAAKQVGLTVAFEVYPAKRCRLRMLQGQSDALPLAATESNRSEFQFPMRGTELDASRRIVSTQLVWVKRKDSPLAWDGQTLQGGDPGKLLVGTRSSFRVATDALVALGLRVDESAFDVPQLFRKLAAQRIDIAVVLQEEAQAYSADQAQLELKISPIPLLSRDFYLGTRSGLSAERQAQIEAWWEAIGQLRDKPQYRPR